MTDIVGSRSSSSIGLSRKNFVDDALVRSFDCAEALYNLADEGMLESLRQGAPDVRPALTELHDRLRDRLLRCVAIERGSPSGGSRDVVFHSRFGWTLDEGGERAFLGKIRTFEEKIMTIGRRTYLSGGNVLRGSDTLRIGSFCSIGEDFYVNTSPDFHPTDTPATFAFWGEPRDESGEWKFHQPFEQIAEAKTGITIGHDVWIARRVRIFHGADIGHGCVIGEGSLVRGTLEPYGVYAGVPAKLKRFRFPRPVIEQLAELRWWDWERERILRNHAFFNTRLTDFEGDLDTLVVP